MMLLYSLAVLLLFGAVVNVERIIEKCLKEFVQQNQKVDLLSSQSTPSLNQTV